MLVAFWVSSIIATAWCRWFVGKVLYSHHPTLNDEGASAQMALYVSTVYLVSRLLEVENVQ